MLDLSFNLGHQSIPVDNLLRVDLLENIKMYTGSGKNLIITLSDNFMFNKLKSAEHDG